MEILCETCKHGLVRESIIEKSNTTERSKKQTKCMYDESFVDDVVKCNRYKKESKE